jgi:threonine dehydratase
MANDFVRSLAAGHLVANPREPQTIADGVRTLSVGVRNWEILRHRIAGTIEMSEAQIRDAVRLCFALANLKVEPTGALSIAALLAEPSRFRGRRVCCVVSGGNVDPALFCEILSGQ